MLLVPLSNQALKKLFQRPQNSRQIMSQGANIFRKSGERLGSEEDFFREISKFKGDVLLIGENHSDPEAHKWEKRILERVLAENEKRKFSLSLEFYDREAQVVLDEYLNGSVSKETFLEDSRPPSNHGDYQPLIDFCKEKHIPVIASNCPRRYTRMVTKLAAQLLETSSLFVFIFQVSKLGRSTLMDSVTKVPKAAELLPKLPYQLASEKYKKNFLEIMGSIGTPNPNVATSMLDAQSLWDATMADSIVKALDHNEFVIHIAGSKQIKCEKTTTVCDLRF